MEETMEEIHALFCGGYTVKESQVFVSTLQHLLKRIKIKEEHDAATTTRCWATPQHWLLTVDTPSLRAALWNPSTQTKVELPPVEKDLPQNSKCLLSREPGSRRAGGCVVLVVDDDEPVIWFCRVGGERWTRHEYDITVEEPPGSPLILLRTRREHEEEERAHLFSREQEEGPTEYILEGDCNWKGIRPHGTSAGTGSRRSRRFRIRSIAAVDGKFYFDVSSTKLGVLEFAPGPSFATVETERVRVARDSWELAFPHLVESRGRLYLFVITGRNSLSSVAFYRMDFSRMAWSSVDRIYDQVFFLGRLRFTASYAAWELGLRQGDVYYLGPYGLLNVFFAGDKRQPYSNLCHGSDLPAPLRGIHDVLSGACGFTIGGS
ncbi:unnamed protein product [Alopecurus aequalis]